MRISKNKTYKVWALNLDGKQFAPSIVDSFNNLREIEYCVRKIFWRNKIKSIHIYCIDDDTYAVYSNKMKRLY